MKRFDERDIMFVRIGLIAGTKEYEQYYKKHPQYKEGDDEVRNIQQSAMAKKMNISPDKMNKMMKTMNFISKIPFIKLPDMSAEGMPAFNSNDKELDKLRNSTISVINKNANKMVKESNKIKTAKTKIEVDSNKASKQIKELAKYYGADLVGIVKLKPQHLYSHKGSMFGIGKSGEPIKLEYKYAIVIAQELDKDCINRAPHGEQVLGTMKGYSDVMEITSKLVTYLKKIGYNSRGDNFYEYLAPTTPLAIDAGLGEMGRSNMLVSKEFGSRLKMGAVFTNLELVEDGRIDFGLTEFCKMCRLCEKNCPSKAISLDDEPKIIDGDVIWKHKEDKCMGMWMKVGTDCGICMSACPFSQGIDPKLIDKMKDNKEIMKQILTEHTKQYGKRNYISEPLDLVLFR